MLVNAERIKTNAYIVIAFIPLTLFGVYIYHYAMNVPYGDDMELVDTINTIKTDITSMLRVMVRQQNDHRSAFPRLGILVSYAIANTLDFRLTILLGYLNLILLGYSFYLVQQSISKKKTFFTPISILLFSPIVYQIHLCSLTAFQHTLSIAFSILCLYFLQPQKRKYWLISVIFSVFASLTNLDGISLLPVALLWLASQSRWKHFLVYLAFSIIYLILYLTDFKFSSASKLEFTFGSIPLLLRNMVTITGSLAKIISDTHAALLSFIFGTIIVLIFVALKIFPGLKECQPKFSLRKLLDLDFVDICCLRLFASMAMIAIGRFSDGIGSMVAIRFQIYSVSVAILFYLFLLKSLPNKARWRLQAITLPLSIIISVYSYIKYDNAVEYMTDGMKADTYNYPNNRLFLHQYFNLPDPEPEFYKNYKFPVYFPENTVIAWTNNLQELRDPKLTHFSILEIPRESSSGDLYANIQIEVENHEPDKPSKELYLGLISHSPQRNCYILATRKMKSGNYQANMPKKIPTGSYTLTMCWVEKGIPVSRQLSGNILL